MNQLKNLFDKYYERAEAAEKTRLRLIANKGHGGRMSEKGYVAIDVEVRNCTYPSIMPLALRRQAYDSGVGMLACAILASAMAEVISALDRVVKLEIAIKRQAKGNYGVTAREADNRVLALAEARVKSCMEFFTLQPTMMRFWCEVAGLEIEYVNDIAEKDLATARKWYEIFKNKDRSVQYRLTK